MFFLSELYGHGSFNEMLVDLCFYCHTSELEVVSESEVVVEQHHRLLGISKANC